MIEPLDHPLELERISALSSYNILDTLSEEEYDHLTMIAAEICGTPISLVSLVDEGRQWFKSRFGLSLTETPRRYAFCAHAINGDEEVFEVMDARTDDRFHDNPLVTHNGIVFYAGVPLRTEKGLPLGTLCVIDKRPNKLNCKQTMALKALGKQAMNLLELRKKKIELEVAVDQLRAQNEELEKFAYIAAHDIRSPLSNIVALADLFLDTEAEQVSLEGRIMIEAMQSSSLQLKKLVEGLLAYSRNTRILHEDKMEFNLCEFVSRLKILLTNNGTCEVRLRTQLDTIYANKIALEQIMINLMANAIKYNDKAIPEINIEVEDLATQYRFSVSDNGPGIEMKHHNRIFGIFETFHAVDRFGQKGTGMGLASVKKLVEKMGGNIGLESQLGRGSTFCFTIAK